MNTLRSHLAVLTLLSVGLAGTSVYGVEVLVNGNLESSVSPMGWNLSTSITGQPGSTIPSLFEHNDGANFPMVTPGQLGLLIKPQAGNQGTYEGMNLKTNLVLEQVATGIAGRIYTFSGHSYWGGDADPGTLDGYSGGVTTLHSGSPSDPTPDNPDDPASVPSPTMSTYEVAFLNASDVVLGTPTVLDLRTVATNDAAWIQNSVVTPAAPAGTSKVRVRATMTDIVDNFGFQNVQLDNFSLRDNIVPGLERLTNPNLDSPGDPAGWTLVEGPMGADSGAFINFAQHAGVTGAQGLWLRPFVNVTQFDPDIPSVFATMSQTVPGVAGGEYTFSAWTAWETGYSGGISGSGTTTTLKMEFLDSSNAVIGSPATLELFAAGMTNDQDGGNLEPDDWRQFSLMATAPAGTANVRVSMDAQGMFDSGFNPQSAFFDDFSLNLVTAGLLGDFNEDGSVDAADYVVWRKNVGTTNTLPNDNGIGGTVGTAHYNLWSANFGMTSPGSGVNLLDTAAAVPEPAVWLLAASAVLVGAAFRRRCAIGN